MLITFIIMSVFVGAFLTIIWSKEGFLNLLIKLFCFGYTMFGIVVLLVAIQPLLVGTNIRLF